MWEHTPEEETYSDLSTVESSGDIFIFVFAICLHSDTIFIYWNWVGMKHW